MLRRLRSVRREPVDKERRSRSKLANAESESTVEDGSSHSNHNDDTWSIGSVEKSAASPSKETVSPAAASSLRAAHDDADADAGALEGSDAQATFAPKSRPRYLMALDLARSRSLRKSGKVRSRPEYAIPPFKGESKSMADDEFDDTRVRMVKKSASDSVMNALLDQSVGLIEGLNVNGSGDLVSTSKRQRRGF